MTFTATPLDGSTTPIPMSSAVPDGTNTPFATEGGPPKTTGGNTLVPVAVYQYDGYDVTQGLSTDANTVASVMGRLTKIRDLLNATLTVVGTITEANSGAILTDLASSVTQATSLNTVTGLTSDAAVTGDNPGTNSAKFRGLSKIWANVWDSVNGRLNVLSPAVAGYVALTTPPSATNAGSDTALTFSSQINTAIIQNNTAANIYYAFDVAATLGSLVLAPGYYLEKPKKVTVLHLYTVAAQNINGSAVGGIVVLGEL